MRQLRVGCVGTGFIAHLHLQALARFPEVQLVAVADPFLERAQATAAHYSARWYRDGVELLEAEDLDAVWLCVPPFAHGPVEALAVDRALPFFVEKPVALDLATAADIAGRVRETGLLTAVGYHWRHLEAVDRLRLRLRDHPPRLVLGQWLDATPPPAWWSRRNQSGGQQLEQVTHLFDLARVFVGEVDTVHALELTPDGESPDGHVPVASVANLRFVSGAIGTVAATRVLPSRHRVGLQVVSDGMVAEMCERSLSDHECRVVTAEGEELERSDEDPIEAEDRQFVDAVLGRNDGVVSVPYEEALRTHALAWAADQSAQAGVAVQPVTEVLSV